MDLYSRNFFKPKRQMEALKKANRQKQIDNTHPTQLLQLLLHKYKINLQYNEQLFYTKSKRHMQKF